VSVKEKVKGAPLWAKVVGIGVLGFIAAPFVFLTIKGLVGLTLAAMIAMFGIFFFPVLIEKLQNAQFKAFKSEWKHNPIETLQNQYVQKVEWLQERHEQLKIFIGSVAAFKSKADTFRARFPNSTSKVKSLEESYAKLFSLQEYKKKKYQTAVARVGEFKNTIEEADIYWQAARAANEAFALDQAEEDPLERIKTETSLGAVETELNKAFAELDMALLDTGAEDMKLIEATPVLRTHSTTTYKGSEGTR
jgi:hypothetical protein